MTSRKARLLPALAMGLAIFLSAPDGASSSAAEKDEAPLLVTALLFPLESWHNHGSCVVEAANGDLLACWFHGSGERTADDVRIEGARLRHGERAWSPRVTWADTPDYPDTNPCLIIDPRQRLWLFYPTILAHQWESALLKYRISRDYLGEGPPRWEISEVLHVTPGPEFEPRFLEHIDRLESAFPRADLPAERQRAIADYAATLRRRATDKLSRRLGWMTRAHPIMVDQQRLIVPLYSDGFDASLMVYTDDWGGAWRASNPLLAAANIQPSLVRRQDGSLFTLMRDNGPAPHRLHQSESRDRGATWGPVTDSPLPNPGSGAEIIGLANGHWVLIGNDTEEGRHQLAVQLSDDEGRTWKWKRYLEQDPPGPEAGRYHYPSLLQARDGSLHATYSYHLGRKNLPLDSQGKPAAKSIKYAHFNLAWIKAGQP